MHAKRIQRQRGQHLHVFLPHSREGSVNAHPMTSPAGILDHPRTFRVLPGLAHTGKIDGDLNRDFIQACCKTFEGHQINGGPFPVCGQKNRLWAIGTGNRATYIGRDL